MPGPPRVLVVAPLFHPDRGGLGRQAVLLTERVAAAGARALVATRAMTGLPARRASPLVELYPLPAGRPDVHNYEAPDLTNLLTSLRFSAQLAALLVRRRRDYDVVHIHGASLPFLLALPVARALGKRVVGKVAALHQGVEAGDLAGHYGPLGRVLAWWAAQSDAFVATTEEIREALAREGVPSERIVRLPNFVDVSRFSPAEPAERTALRAALGWEGRTVALCAGRLSERKNVDLLLRAYARRLPELAAARPLLAIAGDGPERARLEALARELGLGDAARFLGFEREVERLYRAADLLVIASRVEGLPNALLEAMACGLPVVATDLGGARDVLREGETGLLVPPDAEAPLGEALARALGDPALRERMGAAATARIRERYTLEAIAPRYLELYARLLAGEPPQGAGHP
ncbi:MAG: glycosyltransferase family 4 protein [Planctomycetota bacterium]